MKEPDTYTDYAQMEKLSKCLTLLTYCRCQWNIDRTATLFNYTAIIFVPSYKSKQCRWFEIILWVTLVKRSSFLIAYINLSVRSSKRQLRRRKFIASFPNFLYYCMQLIVIPQLIFVNQSHFPYNLPGVYKQLPSVLLLTIIRIVSVFLPCRCNLLWNEQDAYSYR